jgi:hypothetical protein
MAGQVQFPYPATQHVETDAFWLQTLDGLLQRLSLWKIDFEKNLCKWNGTIASGWRPKGCSNTFQHRAIACSCRSNPTGASVINNNSHAPWARNHAHGWSLN